MIELWALGSAIWAVGLRARGSGGWDPSLVLLALVPVFRALGSQLSFFGYRLSAFCFQLFDLGDWFSAISSGPGALGFGVWASATWLLGSGLRLLDLWLSALGFWILALGLGFGALGAVISALCFGHWAFRHWLLVLVV